MKLPGRRILFVDREADIRDMMVLWLHHCGYTVAAAGTIGAGLKLAQSERFDLFLLAEACPDGTTLQLCQHLRAFDQRRPIVFYTTQAFEADRQRAMTAGAQEYLTKPCDLDLLEQSISRLIDQAAVQGSHEAMDC